MSFIYSNDYIVILIIAGLVFLISYLKSDAIISYINNKTEGTRREVLELIDLMMLDVDKKKITLTIYLLSLGLGALVFLLVWPNVLLGIFLGAVFAIIGWKIPQIIMRHLWNKRCNLVVNQMVDGMTIMGNGIKAGLSITQTMERVGLNMSGPLPDELNLVLNKVRLGMTVEEALNDFGNRIPRPDVQMLVTSVNILKETGGNLAETFETIVNVVRERQKIEKRIQAMTSQGITQGVIVTMVPFIIMLVFVLTDPAFIAPLFTKPLGWVILAIMLGLQIIGGVMIKKIVTIKV